MNLLNDIRARLQPMGYEERDKVAQATGVPFSTVQKIAIGVTENPRIHTVEALMKHFGVVCKLPKVSVRKTAKAA